MKIGYLFSVAIGVMLGWLGNEWFMAVESPKDKAVESSSYTANSQAHPPHSLTLDEVDNGPPGEIKVKQKQGSNISPQKRDMSPDTDFEKIISQLVSTNLQEEALGFLLYQLSSHSTLVDAVDAAAARLIARGDYLLAMELFYEVLLKVTDSGQQDWLALRMRQRVAEIEQDLAKQRRIENIIGLYQYLISQSPQHMYLYLRMAFWQIQTQQWDAAEQTLVATANDFQSSLEADYLRSLIEEKRLPEFDRAGQIKLQKRGKHYLVKVAFNDDLIANLLIDTGASTTAISADFFRQHQLENFPRQTAGFYTANGWTEAFIIRLQKLRIGNTDIAPVHVAVLDLEGLQADGLLGMNVLQNFQFAIDQQTSTLQLSPLIDPDY